MYGEENRGIYTYIIGKMEFVLFFVEFNPF